MSHDRIVDMFNNDIIDKYFTTDLRKNKTNDTNNIIQYIHNKINTIFGEDNIRCIYIIIRPITINNKNENNYRVLTYLNNKATYETANKKVFQFQQILKKYELESKIIIYSDKIWLFDYYFNLPVGVSLE